jgi:hypothetical protein
MKYKTLVLTKVDHLESQLAKAETAVNHQNGDLFYLTMESIKEQLEDIRRTVELEQEG